MANLPNSVYRQPVTAIIPAHNEEKHLGAVLAALRQVEALTQIIVVDDGSVDETAKVVHAGYRLDKRTQLVHLPVNQGKGKAMLAGITKRYNDLLLFLDADLLGLRPENITALLEPVQRGEEAMTIGIFRDGRGPTDWSHKLTPFLSGQRCLRWSLFADTPDIDATRWSIEMSLSLHAWRRGYSVSLVPWSGVTHVMRSEKTNKAEAVWSHLQMWLEIGKYAVRQLFAKVTGPARQGKAKNAAVVKRRGRQQDPKFDY